MGEAKRRGTYAERKAQGEIETEQFIKKMEATERRLPRSKDHHNALAIAAMAAGMMAPRLTPSLTATVRTPSMLPIQDFRTSLKRQEVTKPVDLEALTDDVLSETINLEENTDDFSGFWTGLQTATVAKEVDLESPSEQIVPEAVTRPDGPEFLA